MTKYYFSFLLLMLLFKNVLFVKAQVNVLTQHNDLKRTGWMHEEKVLNQSNVNSTTFGKIFTRQVDDEMYAQPLVVSNLYIKGRYHNIVFTATVNNTVYAFDADSDTANTPLWKTNLTYPGYRPIHKNDITTCSRTGYKAFSGNMGIVSTPVIDSATKTLYVVTRSASNTTPVTYVQYLHAIDVTTGIEKPNSPVRITATVNGNGDGNINGKITFDPLKQNQRAGLLLYKNVIYIAWASHCDVGPYHGWVMGYEAKTLQRKYVYNATPEGDAAGIWMSGQAPAVDDNGFIYVSTGNGTVGRNNLPNDTINRGESLLKLSTKTGKLKVVDFFTPHNYPELELNDLDYGTDGVMLIPNTRLSLSGSKQSFLYLIDNNQMGGTTADDSNARQIINIQADGTTDHHLHGSPVYFRNYNKKEYIYAWAEGSQLKQIPFNRATQKFDTANTITYNAALSPGMPGGVLALSSNKLVRGTGILWVSHPTSADANKQVVSGTLRAFNAGDVTQELWNSNQNAARDSVGNYAKFVCPTVANGKVYLSTFSKQLIVYGLLPSAVANKVVSTSSKSNFTFEIFPNPANNQFTINYKESIPQSNEILITLLDNYGQSVLKRTAAITNGESIISIDLPATIHNGIYVLQIKNTSGEAKTKSLVIEK